MNAEMLAAIIALLALGLGQFGLLISLTFKAGKVNQQVDDHERRINKVESTTDRLVNDVAELKGREQFV